MFSKNDTLKDNLRAIAEAVHFPEIGRTFYESGPQTGKILTTKILQKHINAGELAVTVCPWPRASFSPRPPNATWLFILRLD